MSYEGISLSHPLSASANRSLSFCHWLLTASALVVRGAPGRLLARGAGMRARVALFRAKLPMALVTVSVVLRSDARPSSAKGCASHKTPTPRGTSFVDGFGDLLGGGVPALGVGARTYPPARNFAQCRSPYPWAEYATWIVRERQHCVLAQAEEFDIFDYHHLIEVPP